MKHSAKKKAGKRATKKGLGAKPVTTAQKTPVGSTPAKAARTAGLKAPVDWVAAGRKAWETRQRNLAAGGAPVKKAKVATVATVPDAPIDAPITLDEIGESATL